MLSLTNVKGKRINRFLISVAVGFSSYSPPDTLFGSVVPYWLPW